MITSNTSDFRHIESRRSPKKSPTIINCVTFNSVKELTKVSKDLLNLFSVEVEGGHHSVKDLMKFLE